MINRFKAVREKRGSGLLTACQKRLVLILSLLTLSSSLLTLSAATLSLATTNDYLWTTGAAPYSIIGVGMGPAGDYCSVRGEDPAFLFESYMERNDVAEILGDEDDNTQRFPLGGATTFPSAIITRGGRYPSWLYLCETGYSYMNHLMQTNATPCNALYDASKTLSSMREIVNSKVTQDGYLDESELTNLYTTTLPYLMPRQVAYLHHGDPRSATNDVYSIYALSMVVTNLYADFAATDALQFCGKRPRSAGGWRFENYQVLDYADWATWYGESGWTLSQGSEERSSTDTVRDHDVFTPSYFVSFTASKQTAGGYNGKSLVATLQGTSVSSSERYNNPIGQAYVEFHHALSNHIAAVEGFALVTVRHTASWPTDGLEGPMTNVTIRSTHVIVPLGELNEISSKTNGARRFSFMIEMPTLAHGVIGFLGESYPDANVILAKLSFPDPPSAYPVWPESGKHFNVTATYSSSESINIRCLELIGVAKISWRTKVIERNDQ